MRQLLAACAVAGQGGGERQVHLACENGGPKFVVSRLVFALCVGEGVEPRHHRVINVLRFNKNGTSIKELLETIQGTWTTFQEALKEADKMSKSGAHNDVQRQHNQRYKSTGATVRMQGQHYVHRACICMRKSGFKYRVGANRTSYCRPPLVVHATRFRTGNQNRIFKQGVPTT